MLFVNMWGRHVVSKNTFIGRVEIPLTMVIDHLVLEKLDLATYKEMAPVTRWFKLLPQHGSNAWDQAPGFVRMTLQYKYVPEVVPTRVVPSAPPISTTSGVVLPAPSGAQPPNTTLCYQCPLCSQLFVPDTIMAHMQACAAGAPSPVPATNLPEEQPRTVQYQVQHASAPYCHAPPHLGAFHPPSAPQFQQPSYISSIPQQQQYQPSTQQVVHMPVPQQQPAPAVLATSPPQQSYASAMGVPVYPPGVMQQLQQQLADSRQQSYISVAPSYPPPPPPSEQLSAPQQFAGVSTYTATPLPTSDISQYYSYATTMVGGPASAQ